MTEEMLINKLKKYIDKEIRLIRLENELAECK